MQGGRIDVRELLLRLRSAVGADGGVQAIICHEQALYRSAVDDVRLDDFVDIGGGDASVPDRVWVDDDGRTVLALVEAS